MALVKITDPELAYALWQNGMLYNEAGHLWGEYGIWASAYRYSDHTSPRLKYQLRDRAYTHTEE